MTSTDLTDTNIKKLAELFPNVITETLDADGNPKKAVNFDLLHQELSNHVVEGPQERYQLDWPGKRAAAFAANAPIAKTLRPVGKESVNFDTTKNLFIEGDNLDALKLLQESYLGRVKLIYIDPPYNTGNDFIYDDDYAETTGEYLVRSGQADDVGAKLVANPESNGRFHSDWLSMMYPRLKLARNLLTDDGLIFISIDDGEVGNLRKICDEVFGATNFAGQLVWKKGGTGKNDSQFAVVEHEYIMCYARNADVSGFGVDEEGTVTTSYNQQDEHGKYSLVRLDQQNLQYSPSLDYDLVGPDGLVYKLNHKNPAHPNAIWRWSTKRVQDEMAKLVFKDGKVYTKNYAKSGAKARSILAEERFGVTRTGKAEAEAAFGQASLFDFPKPVRLIRHLVRIANDRDAVVLDFFAGSGTTAHAVIAQNAADGGKRQFILVQLADELDPESEAARAGYTSIAALSRERIRRAGARVVEDTGLGAGGLDVGFRALTVDTTNMAEVLQTPTETDQQTIAGLENSVKSGRTGPDLLFQVLLDWGLELTMPIAAEKLEGHDVFVVEDDAVIACFDSEISLELVSVIAKREPLRAVFRDSGFASDDARINAEQIFREISPSTNVKVI